MKRWGATLLVLGIASFVLPMVGMQLRILNLFGPGSQPAVGALMILVGGVLLAIGTFQERHLATSAGQAPAASVPAHARAVAGAGAGAATGAGGVVAAPPSPAMPATQRCATCGRALRPGDVFCEQCGTKLTKGAPPTPATRPAAPARSTKRVCPNPKCGRSMAKDKKFCTACGTRLVG